MINLLKINLNLDDLHVFSVQTKLVKRVLNMNNSAMIKNQQHQYIKKR